MKRTKREVLCVVALLATAGSVLAQDAAASAKGPTYDVISVKPHDATDGQMRFMTGDDSFEGMNLSLAQMIRFAYGLKSEDQIAEMPKPFKDAHFDVHAKMDSETAATLKNIKDNDARSAQQRLMLQGVLAERFHLKVHHESRVMPVYDLVVAKGGFKLKDADPNNTYENGIKTPDGKSHPGMFRFKMGSTSELTAQAMDIGALTNFLSQQEHRQVVDKTGLKGKYDFTLAWTPDEMAMKTDAPAGDTKPGLSTALEEELGLKIEAAKGSVETVVIDHLEMPEAD